MMTALLSWLSKSKLRISSSTVSSSSSLSLLPSSSSMPSHRHRYRHPAGRRHHLLGKILRKNSVSTIHKYWMLLTNYNYQPHSFHFPRRSFGNKTGRRTWLSEDIANAGKVGLTVHTWLHYDESKDLCMKAVKKSTWITSRCAEKASIQERCQSR